MLRTNEFIKIVKSVEADFCFIVSHKGPYDSTTKYFKLMFALGEQLYTSQECHENGEVLSGWNGDPVYNSFAIKDDAIIVMDKSVGWAVHEQATLKYREAIVDKELLG